jgi:hypothetical protein
MFADDQVTISNNEETLQRAIHELNKILDHNFDIYIHKTKNTAFCGKWPVKSKLILDNNQQNKSQNSAISVANFHTKVKLTSIIK